MSKQSNRRKRAKQQAKPRPPLFTTPIIEPTTHRGVVLPSDSAKQVQFLAAYAILGVIGQAAKTAGCNRDSHRYWLTHDPDYPARFADAQATANEALEIECRRRAKQGVERMKFYKGEPIIDPRSGKPYIEHEFSDRLLELALKAHLPDKYAERRKIESVTTLVDPVLQAALIDLGEGEPMPEALDGIEATAEAPDA